MFLANKTVHTRAAYEEDLKQFWAWCESFPVAPLGVDKIHVQLYLEYLQARGSRRRPSPPVRHRPAVPQALLRGGPHRAGPDTPDRDAEG
jgi:hypothetical protein